METLCGFLHIDATVIFQNIAIDKSLLVETKELSMNSINKLFIKVCLVSAATMSCSVILAQTPQQGQGKPPAEAMQACKALSSGQDCSFTTDKGSRAGTCWAPEGKPLACKPKMPAAANGKNQK